MRKLKLQCQLTVDGFIAGANGEMDWMVWDWDDKLKAYVEEITEPVDCIIMGKSFAAGFIPHWAKVANNLEHPESAFGQRVTEMQKVVFSTEKTRESIEDLSWNNTQISDKPLREGVTALKNEAGGDIIVYGGSQFVSALIGAGLIDEFHLFINPTALGKGMTIFHQLESKQNFTITSAQQYDCGIVVLKYLK
jgi:dihydrofolate reductase